MRGIQIVPPTTSKSRTQPSSTTTAMPTLKARRTSRSSTPRSSAIDRGFNLHKFERALRETMARLHATAPQHEPTQALAA